MKHQWPNFLIVGAAKAGTTALYHQLNAHPDVFMSSQKEMNFFALKDQIINFKGPGDMNGIHRTSITNQDNYLSFFQDSCGYSSVGEVSPLYLYSEKAPGLIYDLVPNMKIIVMLRNPIHRAFSAFSHLRRDQRETEEKFELAFQFDEKRKNQGWAEIWHYKSMGMYYDQVKRYNDLFPSGQIMYLVYEDFLNNPPQTLKTICDFLNIDSSFSFQTEKRYNKSGTPKINSLHQLLVRPHRIKKMFKHLLPKSFRTKLRESVININLDKQTKLTQEQFDSIFPVFEKDIEKTESLLEINLSHWKTYDIS